MAPQWFLFVIAMRVTVMTIAVVAKEKNPKNNCYRNSLGSMGTF